MMNIKTLLAFLICLMGSMLSAQQWTLQKEKNDIKAYTKPVDDSKYHAFKITTITQHSPESIIAQIVNVEDYPNVFESVSKAYVFHSTDQLNYQSLSFIDIPWPFNDRIMALQNQIVYDSDKESFTLNLQCIDNPTVENISKDDLIVICSGYWTVNKMENGLSSIEYSFHVDMDINLPAWLVNLKTIKEPMESFEYMLENAKLEQHQNFSLEQYILK